MDIRKMTMEQIEALVSRAEEGSAQTNEYKAALESLRKDAVAARKAIEKVEKAVDSLLSAPAKAQKSKAAPGSKKKEVKPAEDSDEVDLEDLA